ncbi:MAG: lysine biosynthesis protein LysW [bacterium]
MTNKAPDAPAAAPIKCSECNAVLKLPVKVELNEIIPCKECGTEFEVIAVKPVKLQLAPLEEEDWGQ